MDVDAGESKLFESMHTGVRDEIGKTGDVDLPGRHLDCKKDAPTISAEVRSVFSTFDDPSLIAGTAATCRISTRLANAISRFDILVTVEPHTDGSIGSRNPIC